MTETARVEEVDVVVLGSGAAGFSAAITAARLGATTLLIERMQYLGGTSALSAGTLWVPLTRHAASVGAEDSAEQVLGYLDHAVGNHSASALRNAFVAHGADAIHWLEDKAGLKFRARSLHPDYLSELPGSSRCGRALEAEPFDGGRLGADLGLVRPPIPEFTVGGMMVDRDDIAHLRAMLRSPRSLLHGARLLASHVVQRLRHGRGSRLVMGNALIGRLLLAARESGVRILTETEVVGLKPLGGGAHSLSVRRGGESWRVVARQATILATGGLGLNPRLRSEMLPKPAPAETPIAPGATGALHDLVAALGAHYPEGAAQPVFWAPVSVRSRADGSRAVFPHFFLDRSKPGTLAVGRDGRRFTNESRSYHEFGAAMYAANRDGSHIPAFLIADARALRRYGLGMVRPGTRRLGRYLSDGYLIRGGTLPDLAQRLGIDADALASTVERYNGFAVTGRDLDFQRGETVYERHNGDPSHGPNPCLGELNTPPFYAVRLFPADIGAATGLSTDPQARLLRRDGSAIEGLFACGADMNSVMGGVYPGPGITIGPGIVFGHLAARAALAEAPPA